MLIFGSSLTTGAYWQSSISLDGGQLSSGSLVLLNGDAVNQVSNYQFTALAGTSLRPGSAVQAPLTMKNGGTAPLTYRLVQTSTSGSTSLAGQLALRLDAVPTPATCATGIDVPAATAGTTLYAGGLVGASTATARPLATGASETLCVRVTVPAAAPQTVQAGSTQTTFTFGAQQP